MNGLFVLNNAANLNVNVNKPSWKYVVWLNKQGFIGMEIFLFLSVYVCCE